MVLCKQSKSQASFEYLVILGIALFLLLPVISMFQNSTSESNNLQKSNSIILSGRVLSSTISDVYYQGKGTRLKISFNFPEGVDLRSVNHTDPNGDYFSELIFTTDFSSLNSDFLFGVYSNLYFTNYSQNPCNLTYAARNISNLNLVGQSSLFVESCGKGNVVVYPCDS